MKLEIGSGYNPTPGFVHLDINPNATDVDLVAPAFPLASANDQIEELRAVDVLEHLSYHHTAEALGEWARVLAPGGMLYVQVPDAHEIMRWYLTEPARLVARAIECGLAEDTEPMRAVEYLLLGGHEDGMQPEDDWRWNAHFALFSGASLRRALIEAGLLVVNIETNGHPNLLAWARKP